MTEQPLDPHAAAHVYTAGHPLQEARAALIILHGRGDAGHKIIGLTNFLDTWRYAIFAPNAVGQSWYPQRFIRPIEENEPHLSSALNLISRVIERINNAGIPTERIVMSGFSQGACLAAEYVARHPRRYGGLAVLSGGLIGQTIDRSHYPADADLAGTPVLVGCGNVDFHIPVERVRETSEILRQMGGTVTERIYPGMDHSINEEELSLFNAMLREV
jgi:predicted esterase